MSPFNFGQISAAIGRKEKPTGTITEASGTAEAEPNIDVGYNPHSPPVLDEDGAVAPVLRIPEEPGRYFPTGAVDGVLLLCEAQLFQMHPKYMTKRVRPIASGTLTLRDPIAGTAEEVQLVGECDGISFYVKGDDATKKIGPSEFMLLLPEDCIGVNFVDGSSPETISRLEALLATRTQFHDESSKEKNKQVEYPDDLPDDKTSRTMFRMAAWTAKMIVQTSEKAAVKIEDYGQKKTESVTDIQEKEVKQSHIQMAERSRKVSEGVHGSVEKITGKISDVIGSAAGKHVTIKENDSATKKTARKVLMTGILSYGEVSEGAGEGYSIMAKQAKKEAVSYVGKKYGDDAAELARHTASAAANFGSAALTARRVVNVKSMAKSTAKKAAATAVMGK